MRATKPTIKRAWTPEQKEQYAKNLEERLHKLGMEITPDYVVLEERKKKNKKTKAKRKTKDCGCK